MQNSNWEKIETVYHKVMAQADSEREALLRESVTSEAEYQEVLKLIRAARIAGDFMHTSIGLEDASPSLQIGDILGAWTVLDNIGSGGMGEVYFVERKGSSFKQIAALKIARTDDEKYLKHFIQERQILAQLEHPNICRLIDGGTADDGYPYIVMELVEGLPLTEFVSANLCSKTQSLGLIRQVCAALAHAHGRLILHRDLKPSNVMVTDAGQVRLIDFGIAALIDMDHGFQAPITRTYAAPEQLAGGIVTTATDIFSLGCLLHEVVTGQRVNTDRVVDAKIPADLKAIIGKCVQQSPSDRYETVQALDDDIWCYQQGAPVQARDGGVVYKASKTISRYRWAFVATALFIFSLIGGLIGTQSQMSIAKRALAETQKAELEREFEARTLQGYFYGLQALYGGDAAQGDEIDPKKIDRSMIRLAETAKARFDGRSIDDAFLLYSMGNVLASRYDFEKAVHFLEPLESLPTDNAILRSLSFEARSDLGRILVETQQTEKARKLLKDLLNDRERYEMRFDIAHVQDVSGWAHLSGLKADRDKAIQVAMETLQILEADGADSSELAWLYNQIGTQQFANDNIALALDAFYAGFKLEAQSGIHSLDDITGATNLALFQIYFGWEGQEPLSYLNRYLKPALDEFGSPETYAYIQGLRGEAALMEKNWTLAAEALADGLPHIEDDRPFRSGWYYEMIVMQVRALAQLGNQSKAREILDRALEEYGAEPDTSDWGFTHCKLIVIDGYLTAFEGRPELSLDKFSRGVEICKTVGPEPWSEQKVIPRWLNDLSQEMKKVNP